MRQAGEERALEIRAAHIEKLRRLLAPYRKVTRIPSPDNWQEKSGEDLWLDIIAQVMVVGRSDPAGRFRCDANLCRALSYVTLSKLTDAKVLESYKAVFSKVGCRFPNKKAAVLLENLRFLQSNGHRLDALLSQIARIKGPRCDYRRIKHLMELRLKYLSSKGARDFLIGQGLVRQAIALDVRVINVLDKIGIQVPAEIRGNPTLYDRVEAELLTHVCKPLGLNGAQFDRIIFNNYNKGIAHNLGLAPSRRRVHHPQ